MDGNWVTRRLDRPATPSPVTYGGATLCVVDLANFNIHKKQTTGAYHNKYKSLPDEPRKVRRRSYLLELRGELLLSSVLQATASCSGHERLSVSVHAFSINCDTALHALDPDPADDEAPPPVLQYGRGGTTCSVTTFAVDDARFGWDVPSGSADFIVRSESG
uniref:Uncharacterized protein n=1 Tax=Oryza punctata TaxID=4537 RepID=A0A0E0JY85_ORYPU